MKTKIVFALVSDDTDLYLERALVAVYTTRYYNKDAHIVLATDKRTLETCNRAHRKDFLNYFTETVIFDTEEFPDKKRRSRLIKTSLGSKIRGNFLFIDCDTIIADKLDDIDNFDGIFGMVRNMHLDNDHKYLMWDEKGFSEWGGRDDVDYFFNSGVIYVRDCETTRNIYKKWNENWRKGLEKGITIDQPSFHDAIHDIGLKISVLPDIWNLQIAGLFIPYLHDAKIIHTFTNPESTTPYILKNTEIYQRIKDEESIPADIMSLIMNPKSAFEKYCLVIDEDDTYIRMRVKAYYRLLCFYKTDKSILKAFDFITKILMGVLAVKLRVKGIFKPSSKKE